MLRSLSGADIRALKVFRTVADAGGFTAAQQILNVSQPTISTHITNLETRLGFKLCDRGRSGFKLTERGESTLRQFAHLSDQINLFCQEMGSLASRLVGELRLGIVDNVINNENCRISDAIGRFRGRNQDVRLRINVGTYRRLERYLLENRIDVAIAIFPSRLRTINYVDIFTEDQSIYCGRSHPFFGLKGDDISDESLQDVDWVDTGYIAEQAQKFVPPSHLSTATAPNQEAVAQFLLSGCHVGYLPVDYAQQWVDSGALWKLEKPGFNYTATFSVAHLGSKRSNRMLQAFLEDLLEVHEIPVSR